MFIEETFIDWFLKTLRLALVIGLLLNAQNLKKKFVLLKTGHTHTSILNITEALFIIKA